MVEFNDQSGRPVERQTTGGGNVACDPIDIVREPAVVTEGVSAERPRDDFQSQRSVGFDGEDSQNAAMLPGKGERPPLHGHREIGELVEVQGLEELQILDERRRLMGVAELSQEER